MDLLKSLNETLNAQELLRMEVIEFIAEMDELESKNLFKLDEVFGIGKSKEADRIAAARRGAMVRGKVGSVEKNKEGEWQGGSMGEGRLSELAKLYGKPIYDNGAPPKRPVGMSPEDYKIWLKGFPESVKKIDNGPVIGPERNDVIRINGQMYLVVGSKGLTATAKNKDGETVNVDWDKLSAPSEVAGKKVFNYTKK